VWPIISLIVRKQSHDLSEFLSCIVEEVDDMLRAAFKLLSEVRILCSNADNAYVNVAIIGDEVVNELEFTTVDLNCPVFVSRHIGDSKGAAIMISVGIVNIVFLEGKSRWCWNVRELLLSQIL